MSLLLRPERSEARCHRIGGDHCRGRCPLPWLAPRNTASGQETGESTGQSGESVRQSGERYETKLVYLVSRRVGALCCRMLVIVWRVLIQYLFVCFFPFTRNPREETRRNHGVRIAAAYRKVFQALNAQAPNVQAPNAQALNAQALNARTPNA